MPAEAEGVAQGHIDLLGAAHVRAHIQVALRVLVLDVDGRGDEVILNRHHASHQLDTAGSTEEVTRHRLGGADNETVLGIVTEGALDGLHLAHIAHGGGSTVRVDVVHLLRLETGVIQGHLHAAAGTLALRQRRSQVVSIRAETVAGHLRQNAGTASLRVLQRLQHHHTGTLAHHKAIAPGIIGAGGRSGVIVAGGERLHVGETGNADGQDGSLRTAADHHVRIAELHDAPSLTDGVVGGSAGGGDAHVRAAEAVLHAHHAGSHVRDEVGNAEGRHATRAGLDERLDVGAGGTQATDTGADHHTHALLVHLLRVQPGILQSHGGSPHGELLKAVATAHGLGVLLEVGRGVKATHLAGNLRGKGRGIYALDAGDAGATGLHALPRLGNTIAQGGQDTHTCNYNTSVCHSCVESVACSTIEVKHKFAFPHAYAEKNVPPSIPAHRIEAPYPLFRPGNHSGRIGGASPV